MADITNDTALDERFAALPQELQDAAKRASDFVNEALVHYPWDVIKSHCVAIRLSDGGSDRVLYENKKEAVKHQLHEQQCAYVFFRNMLGGSTPREMAEFIKFNREAYKAGFRLVDPDDQFGGPDVAMTTLQHDYQKSRMFGNRAARRRMQFRPNSVNN